VGEERQGSASELGGDGALTFSSDIDERAASNAEWSATRVRPMSEITSRKMLTAMLAEYLACHNISPVVPHVATKIRCVRGTSWQGLLMSSSCRGITRADPPIRSLE